MCYKKVPYLECEDCAEYGSKSLPHKAEAVPDYLYVWGGGGTTLWGRTQPQVGGDTRGQIALLYLSSPHGEGAFDECTFWKNAFSGPKKGHLDF